MKASIPGGSVAAKLNTDTAAFPDREAPGMDDDMDMQNSNAGPGEISVPADALSIDGTAPESGDPVTFTVSGTVSRMDGGFAVVRMEQVNDQPVKPSGSEEDRVRAMADDADGEMDNDY